MGLVLGLLDQVYGLRRQMRRLCDARRGAAAGTSRTPIRRALAAKVGRLISGEFSAR